MERIPPTGDPAEESPPVPDDDRDFTFARESHFSTRPSGRRTSSSRSRSAFRAPSLRGSEPAISTPRFQSMTIACPPPAARTS